MSIIKPYTINSGTMEHRILVTANQVDNDYNGNPQYVVQVWVFGQGSETGHIWNPKLKGYRDRKDQSYKIQAYNLKEDLNRFVEEFEKHIQEVTKP
jgi:hypothetical protein